MVFIAIIIIVLIFLGIGNTTKPTKAKIYNNRNPKQYKSIKKSAYSGNDRISFEKSTPTIAELVRAGNTIEEFEEFEKRYEEIYKVFSADFDNKFNEKMYRRYENAFSKIDNKISDKVFYGQYLPQLDLNTPLKTLSNAYKVFNTVEYKLKRKNTDPNDWQEFTGNELMGGHKIESLIKNKPDYFTGLFQFRGIIEGKLSIDEKSDKILELISNDLVFRKEFFSNENSIELVIKKLLKRN
jgi:hypothetical protein